VGGARALALEYKMGAIAPGREADLIVLDPKATPLLALRNGRAESTADVLFALMTLGDDRAVAATYVAGNLAHARNA
jgi:guanine deaminase